MIRSLLFTHRFYLLVRFIEIIPITSQSINNDINK
jgi:hypothetical protein